MTGLHKMPVIAMGWLAASLMPRNELSITFHMGIVHLENAGCAGSAKLTWKIGMTRLERKCPEMWVPIWCWGIYCTYRACAPEECGHQLVPVQKLKSMLFLSIVLSFILFYLNHQFALAASGMLGILLHTGYYVAAMVGR
jgi:hypothetical protein